MVAVAYGATLTPLGRVTVRVVALPMRGTTVSKTRVRAGGQSVVRIDRGDAAPVQKHQPVAPAGRLAKVVHRCHNRPSLPREVGEDPADGEMTEVGWFPLDHPDLTGDMRRRVESALDEAGEARFEGGR